MGYGLVEPAPKQADGEPQPPPVLWDVVFLWLLVPLFVYGGIACAEVVVGGMPLAVEMALFMLGSFGVSYRIGCSGPRPRSLQRKLVLALGSAVVAPWALYLIAAATLGSS